MTRFELVLITSKSSSLGGAGVGVGLGVGNGGGGGISITFCPAAEIKQQKRDSTAKSSAVPNCFPTRSLFIEPFLMPPELASVAGFCPHAGSAVAGSATNHTNFPTA